tara:strand:+ start:4428 stop:4634 length:207 start_codon:yes stop_codon:yes gene_type:complete
MSKVNYEDWASEDPFHPCLKCGSKDSNLNMITDLYTCNNCGEALIMPKESHKKKRPVKNRPRLEEDWE